MCRNSKFADMHPGGLYALTQPSVAGKDSTQQFFGLHRSEVLEKYKSARVLGHTLRALRLLLTFGHTGVCRLARSRARSLK